LKEIQEEIMLVLLWDIDLMMNVNNGAGGDNTSRLIMGEEVITLPEIFENQPIRTVYTINSVLTVGFRNTCTSRKITHKSIMTIRLGFLSRL
jgi:hypothetical protein